MRINTTDQPLVATFGPPVVECVSFSWMGVPFANQVQQIYDVFVNGLWRMHKDLECG